MDINKLDTVSFFVIVAGLRSGVTDLIFVCICKKTDKH